MRKIFIALFLCCLSAISCSQENNIDQTKIREDFNEMLRSISNNYVYLEEKKVDFDCLQNNYGGAIDKITTEEESVLFFEYLLDEFYDNHITLTTNRNSSYRLFAPMYVQYLDSKLIIANVWQTEIANLDQNLIGAQILQFNGVDFAQKIKEFPTKCHNKELPEIKEWIANKILAGRYNESRKITLKLSTGKKTILDLDSLKLLNHSELLTAQVQDNIAIIRINNSLGNDNLVSAFDSKLDQLMNTKGLILDLRNTIFGGDSYEARGIMSRFITEPRPYQKHAFMAKSTNNPDVERSWIEYVSPRLKTYTQPVVILVGRWTGSMGEGLAIGFEGMERGHIVGTEMRRLAGEVYDFRFKHQWYAYKLSTAKLLHVNGTPRETYKPKHYVNQSTNLQDQILEKGVSLINDLLK